MCEPIIKNCRVVGNRPMFVWKVFVRRMDPRNKRMTSDQHRTPYRGNLTPFDVSKRPADDHGYSAFLTLQEAQVYGKRFRKQFSIWKFRLSKREDFRIGKIGGLLLPATCVMVKRLKNPECVYQKLGKRG